MSFFGPKSYVKKYKILSKDIEMWELKSQSVWANYFVVEIKLTNNCLIPQNSQIIFNFLRDWNSA